MANPLTRPIDEVVEVTLHLPAEWACFNEFFGFEPKPGFRIYAADGREIAYQRIAQDMNRTKVRPRPRHYPQIYRTNDVTVALPLRIPALGYTALTVREGEMAAKDEIVAAAMLPTRHPSSPGLATSERTLENQILTVTVEANGSLTLLDKRFPGKPMRGSSRSRTSPTSVTAGTTVRPSTIRRLSPPPRNRISPSSPTVRNSPGCGFARFSACRASSSSTAWFAPSSSPICSSTP
jgi:hypothetical protein